MNRIDINKIIRDTAALDESLSQYETRNADGSISFVVSQGASNYYSTNTGRSFLESTSVPDVISEEETDDEDDDELMAWVAQGRLPANVDTTLALNQAYQEVMEQCIRHVESVLFRVRERHKALQEIVDKKCQNTVINRPHKVPAQLYMFPYFRDSAEMCPPMNSEAQKKLYDEEYFDMLVEPRLKWSTAEKNVLTKAVKDFCLQKKIRPIFNQQEIYKEKPKLTKETKAQMKSNTTVLKKLTKQQDRLKYFGIFFLCNEYFFLSKLSSCTRESNEIIFDEDDDWTDIDWNLISTVNMNGVRSATECRLMWNNHLTPSINRDPWGAEELALLKKLADSNKGRNWKMIASKLKTNRSLFDCAEKYQMELNDNLVKCEWNAEEDAALTEAVERVRIGEYIPWDQVLVFLEGRTKLQVLNRWRRSVNPKLKHGRWSFDEDKLIMEALHKFGKKKDWKKIADHVGSRSDAQCRDRWVSVLNAQVKNEAWTAKEDATLFLCVSTFGKSWASAAKLLPGRTNSACKIRYKMLDKKGIKDANSINTAGNKIAEKRVTACRRQHQKQRIEKVHTWFTSNFGALPKHGENDVSKFLNTLPSQIRTVVSRKLGTIHRTFGLTSVKREIAASIASGKSSVAGRALGVGKAGHVVANQGDASSSATTSEQRRRTVDQETMSILRNSRWPTVCSYPSARQKAKEVAMKAIFTKSLLDHKILPASKSTLIGMKSLLLERSDLAAGVDQANKSNPLLVENEVVLRNYFADREVVGVVNELQQSSMETDQTSDDRIFTHQQTAFVSDDVLDGITETPAFKNIEATFRSLFLWPAIMSHLESQKNG